MNTKDYKAVDPATTLSLEALRKASEGAFKVYDFLPLHPKVVLYLLDMLEAAQQDQARYQWLRESKHFDSDQHQIFCAAYGHALDVAIDAAMAATKGEA